MKIRELLKKIRLRPLQAGDRPADNVDSLGANMHAAHPAGHVPPGMELPPGYVPSQQDDRPPH